MVEESQESISDEEALMKIAQAMKDNAPTEEAKNNVHTFLNNIVLADDTTKVGFLRDGSDKDIDELGTPKYSVRGLKELIRISGYIMNNPFFKEYFEKEAEDVLATSLSRKGFLVKQATTTTKAVADITKRRKINKGWFGKEKGEESGGEIIN